MEVVLMKKRTLTQKGLTLIAALTAIVVLLAGCSGAATPTPVATPKASAAPTAQATGLQTLDFTSLLKTFAKDQNKSETLDRTNIIATDTQASATVGVSHGETTPVIMIKGDPGKLTATSKTSGTLVTDPTKNSYIASALALSNGTPAQYGDGIFKFKMRVSGHQKGLWNNAIIFKDSTPQKPLSDDSVKKALAIVTVGGVVQIQRNYTDSAGKFVKQKIVKDTGVSLADGKYHYFIIAMQDVATGTNVKLWIDGKDVYSGVVTGVTGKGALQILNNSTPMFNPDGSPQITEGTSAGTFQPVTACMESWVGGYEDGPAVANIALDPVK
jgi:hypothetical protein